jgi:ribose transport system permease protein
MPELIRRLRSRYFAPALLLLAALMMVNLVIDPTIFRPSVLPETFATLAPFALAALATTPAVLSGGGGIDVSVAPLMTVVNVVLVTKLMPASGSLANPALEFTLAVALGAAVGAANGVLVTRFRYQPILATLCTVFILVGLALKMAPSPVPAQQTWTDRFAHTVLGVPGGLIFIARPLTLWFLLGRTSWMQNLYATGGDDVAAYSAGVPVSQVRLLAYALGGAFAGLGGIALTAVLRSADASIASQYILIAVTAVALGGTNLAGGRGGLAGSLIGATIIYLIQNAATTLQVPSPWLNVVYGSVLLVAIILAGGLPVRARAAA